VVEELENGDASVRFEAVNAIGEIGEEGDVMYLEEPLDDQDLMVQMAAVAAVEKLGGIAAKRLLQIARQSPEPAVSSAASEALKGIQGEESLIHTVTPEMARQGMFGASVGHLDEGEAPYDAGEREGWGSLTEEGVSFQSPDTLRDDDDDPLSSLMDYEAAPGQFEDDD
jgi:HEAT repeat protein